MLIDAHSHLNRYLLKRFGNSINPLLQEIEYHKILTISNSLDLTSYKTNCRIAKQTKYVVPALGIHPWNAYKYVNKTELVKKTIKKTDIIGEIGLDYYYVKDQSRYTAQKEIFSFFLSNAQNKMLSIHTKGAERDVLRLLRKHRSQKVLIHWVSGDLDVLEEMIEEGYYFSIVPKIKFFEYLQEIVRRIPLEQLLTETDNPGGPASYLGSKGMPVLIKTALEELARIKAESIEKVMEQVENNLVQLIGSTISISSI